MLKVEHVSQGGLVANRCPKLAAPLQHIAMATIGAIRCLVLLRKYPHDFIKFVSRAVYDSCLSVFVRSLYSQDTYMHTVCHKRSSTFVAVAKLEYL